MNRRILITVSLLITSAPLIVFAQTYRPMVNIPGISDPANDFNGYINALYALSIAIAALLAVIKIVIAGVKWMLTDIVTSKEDAKNDITSSIFGLIIVIAAVLILVTINPQIVNVDVNLNKTAASDPGMGGESTATGCNAKCQLDIKTNQYRAAGAPPPQKWPLGFNTFDAEFECTEKGGEFYDGNELKMNEHVCLFPPPTLDTSHVITDYITPTARISYLPADAVESQVTAFKNNCPTQISDPAQALYPVPTQSGTVVYRCISYDRDQESYTGVVDFASCTGDAYQDPDNPNYFHCISG